MMYVENFRNWALSMYHIFMNKFSEPNNQFKIFNDNDITIVENTKTGKTGIAKRNPNEVPDKIIGIAVAYARYLNREIPKESKPVKIGSLPNGTAFTYGSNSGDVCYIIGVLPTDKNFLVYCCNYEVYTIYRDTLVHVIK